MLEAEKRTELESNVESRQKLGAQLAENESVQKVHRDSELWIGDTPLISSHRSLPFSRRIIPSTSSSVPSSFSKTRQRRKRMSTNV